MKSSARTVSLSLSSLFLLSMTCAPSRPAVVEAAWPADQRVRSLDLRAEGILHSPELLDQLGRLGTLFDLSGGLPSPEAVDASRPGPGEAQPSQAKARMLESLDFVRSVFKASYAPASWKASYAGWDLDREIEKAREEIRSAQAPTVKDFQRVLRRVIQSTQDYHVNAIFAATEGAELPFMVVAVRDRYFIAWVDRARLSEESFPFQVGDEIVEFEGRATHEVVKDLLSESGGNVEGTDQALAARSLTARWAANGMKVPKDPVTIEVKRIGSKGPVTRQLAWDYTPESVRFDPFRASDINAMEARRPFRPRMDDMLHPGYAEPEAGSANPFAMGARKSFVPDLGEKIWESGDGPEEPFRAYVYRSPDNRLIGYVRIPSYAPRDAEKAVAHFGKLMAKFEKTTDAMVIDQLNNPGGSVFYSPQRQNSVGSGLILG